MKELGASLPLWSVIPFAGILLSIAAFPLVAPHFWHRHYPKVALVWGLSLAVPFLFAYGDVAVHAIAHVYLADYIPFVILLWGLYTIAGGIVVRGDLRGTPASNTALIAFGTAIASIVGTTGASMVLIRPLLRANAGRRHRVHQVVFFIFLVSNIGGSLTPLGDPPLFLGFLRGVPFTWTLHLLPDTLVCCAILLPAFYLLDRRLFAREDDAVRARLLQPREATQGPWLTVAGKRNFWLLAGVLGAVILSASWRPGDVTLLHVPIGIQNLVRDGLIVALGLASLWVTPRALRRENEFSWGPIREVAYLFAGIFVTIIPPLEILRAGENGALAGLVAAVHAPWQYFVATGLLSSLLDNAPTYLAFLSTALGRFHPGLPEGEAIRMLIANQQLYLEAISAGAVFMGANTYIGNAPNFMVKAIAEESGVAMPSFFGYVLRWTLVFLAPTFLLVTLLFVGRG